MKNNLKYYRKVIIFLLTIFSINLISFSDSYSDVKKRINDNDLYVKKRISGKQDAINNVASVFNYNPDAIYEIYGTPNYITTIKFKDDEQLLGVYSGDTANWLIERTVGDGDSSFYMFIKPLFSNMTTNMIILTSKRRYFFILNSDPKKYNQFVRFIYPIENNNLLHFDLNTVPVKPINSKDVIFKTQDNQGVVSINPSFTDKGLASLDFNYEISDENYDFSPTKIYTDGKQTYIEMKKSISESPILMVQGTDGRLEVVNYRQDGNKMLVDRKINRAVLILGDKRIDIRHKDSK